MADLTWVKDIPNWHKMLTEDMQEVLELIGEEKFLLLWERFLRTRISFPEAPLNKLRAEYVKRHFAPGDAGKIARLIGVGETFVFENAPRSQKNERQITIF
jgi:hypothetical protein